MRFRDTCFFAALMGITALGTPTAGQESPAGAIVVSENLIRALVARPINERHRIAQTLMGTYTEGTMVTQGQLDLQLVPAAERGEIELRLQGTATLEDAIGYSGPVTIFSSSRTSIDARKRILLTSSGLQWRPTDARCTTQIDIHEIVARRRLIERIAWRRAGRMQSSVEQAASREAERRTARSIDRLADRGLESGSDILREKLGPSARMLNLASRLRISSTAGRLYAEMFPTPDLRFAVGEQPPVEQNHDGNIVLHEALVGDVSQSLLADATVRDDELLSLMKLVVGSSPRALWVHAREPRWSVTFAASHPLTVHFANGLVRFRMSLDRMQIDDQRSEEPMTVEATYGLEISQDGPVLVRRGQVHLLDESYRTLEDPTAAQQFIGRKLRGVFLPEIRFLGLIPPAGSNWEPLRGLALKELTAEDGWLKVGYQLMPNSRRAPLSISLADDAVTK